MAGLNFNGSSVSALKYNGLTVLEGYFNGAKFWPSSPADAHWSIVGHSFQGVAHPGNPPVLTNNMATLDGSSLVVDVGFGWVTSLTTPNNKMVARSEDGGLNWVERDFFDSENNGGPIGTIRTIFAGPPFNFFVNSDGSYVSFDGKVWRTAWTTVNGVDRAIPRVGNDEVNTRRYANSDYVYTRDKIYFLQGDRVDLYDGYSIKSNDRLFLNWLATTALPFSDSGILSAGSSDWNGIVDHCVGVSASGKLFSVEENKVLRQLPVSNGRAYHGIVGTTPLSAMPALVLANPYDQYADHDCYRWSKASMNFEKVTPQPPQGYTDLKIVWPGIWCKGPNLYVAIARATKPDGTFFWGVGYSGDGLNWSLFNNADLGRTGAAYDTRGCRFSFNPVTRRLVFVRYQVAGTSQGFTTVLP